MSAPENQVNDEITVVVTEETWRTFWSQIPNELMLRKDINWSAKAVWVVLADMTRSTGKVFLSRRRIAQRVGLGLSAVSEGLAALEEKGMISRINRKGSSNAYQIHPVLGAAQSEPTLSESNHPPTGIQPPPVRNPVTPCSESNHKQEHVSEINLARDTNTPKFHDKASILSSYSAAYEEITGQPCLAKPVHVDEARRAEEANTFPVEIPLRPMFDDCIRNCLEAAERDGKGYRPTLKHVINNAEPSVPRLKNGISPVGHTDEFYEAERVKRAQDIEEAMNGDPEVAKANMRKIRELTRNIGKGGAKCG